MKLKRKMESDKDDYLELVKRFPLRVIRHERELDAAASVAVKLAAKGEENLSEGETEYLGVLDRLIEDYEEGHHAMPVGKASALERLRALVKEAGMGAWDSGRLLGNRSLGSLLLSGRREVSKGRVRVVASIFWFAQTAHQAKGDFCRAW